MEFQMEFQRQWNFDGISMEFQTPMEFQMEFQTPMEFHVFDNRISMEIDREWNFDVSKMEIRLNLIETHAQFRNALLRAGVLNGN